MIRQTHRPRGAMRGFVDRLLDHPGIGPMVVHRRRVPGRAARYSEPVRELPEALATALETRGIRRLYTHQAAALDSIRAGHNVLAVTPTASGKTLIFALPVLESVLEDPSARALFLYPTKALAQDQVAGLRNLSAAIGLMRPPRFDIYDGDTPDSLRRKIRTDPPEVLVTNPDMLHLGLLAHHHDWERFLRDLRFVVLDELHVYRGLFGAHVHHVLRRLIRLCGFLGGSPRILAASATVGNPAEFAQILTGERFEVIDASGAPAAGRHVVFLNPVGVSPYTVAVRVVAEAIRAGLRTIAFTKARKTTELLHAWLVQQEPDAAGRVAPYRAGYLPEERREIEARLFRGDLLAVLATSALELGIDVGELDVCVLVGYPGSLISSWQRIGRVGRKDREALVVLIAMPDALDQYVIAHPEVFFGRTFEKAVLDPWNPHVAGQHWVCAAAEEPIRAEELAAGGARTESLVAALAQEGRLVRDADGERWFSFRRRPHRDVNVRSAGKPFTIRNVRTDALLGTVDGMRVYHECHPGAIYLHGGQSFRIVDLDPEARRVVADPAAVDYYTAVLGEKETEILERIDERMLGRNRVALGRLKVTVRIRGYQKKRLFDGEPISEHPLSVPPLVFETVGFWLELPPGLAAEAAARGLHFMGGIHATEHAMIGLFPLLAIADRGDIGGISYTGHPQVGAPAIFVYDGVPGGAGLAEAGYRGVETLLRRVLDLLATCPCDVGCPSCIQSPKCGNGNKPLDKQGALLVLRVLVGEEEIRVEQAVPVEGVHAPPVAIPSFSRRHGITRGGNVEPGPPVEGPRPDPKSSPDLPAERVLFFDVETQRSAAEVGGWGNISRMGLALAVVYDEARATYRTYYEADVERLLLDLVLSDRVVGFNIERFDLEVLSAYTDQDLRRIRTFDLLADLHRRLGFRPSLAHLSEVNLGESKGGDGLQSLRWWKEGRIDLIEQYCRKDVELTRRLYELGRQRKYLLYRDHADRAVRVPLSW